MRAYGVKPKDHGCCPGHDKFPTETYREALSTMKMLEELRQVVADPVFSEGRQTTAYLNRFVYRSAGIEVLDAGTQTTVQDYPGRVGYWDVGVPPSGPFDSLALRLVESR